MDTYRTILNSVADELFIQKSIMSLISSCNTTVEVASIQFMVNMLTERLQKQIELVDEAMQNT